MSDYGVEKLRRLIEPHLELIVEEGRITFPMQCHEGTNVCGKDGRGGRIYANDDFIFIGESDTVGEGVLTFYPSHRDCAESEWGIAHIIPPMLRPHIVVSEIEGIEIERMWMADDLHHAKEQAEDAFPEENIQTVTVTDVVGRTDTLIPAQEKA